MQTNVLIFYNDGLCYHCSIITINVGTRKWSCCCDKQCSRKIRITSTIILLVRITQSMTTVEYLFLTDAASKHALHGYFDSLRAELSHRGIFVSIICPEYINTRLSVNALQGDGRPYGGIIC